MRKRLKGYRSYEKMKLNFVLLNLRVFIFLGSVQYFIALIYRASYLRFCFYNINSEPHNGYTRHKQMFSVAVTPGVCTVGQMHSKLSA